MLTDADVVVGGNFYPYHDYLYWIGSEGQSFSLDSCIGTLFINDNVDPNLKETCKLEFNLGSPIDGMYEDTSMNDAKAAILADYVVKKTDIGSGAIKTSKSSVPEIKSDDGAF